MKKILVLIIAAVLLSGCSRSQYDSLMKDYIPVETETETDINSFEPTESSDTKELFISKWGYSVFQDAATPYLIDEEKVGLMVNIGDANLDDIDNFWTALKINLQTIPTLKDNNDYPYMYVNAVTSDGTPVMVVFIDTSDIENISISLCKNTDYDEYIKYSVVELENTLGE